MNRRGFLAALGTLAGALVGARVAKALPAPRVVRVWKGATTGPTVMQVYRTPVTFTNEKVIRDDRGRPVLRITSRNVGAWRPGE